MRFQCSLCGTIVAVDDVDAGIMVRCGHCNRVVQVPPTRLSRGAVIADFIIQRPIGQGGMGTVYLAHQITLDRPAALKVLAESFADNAEFVARFIKEARAAAKLNHPHIVQAYAVGEDNGLLFFAMENIDGETMKHVLERTGKISVEQALNVVQQIAEALNYAWNEQKLIHCDIKPDNIMLTSTGRAKLADLGLAHVTGDISLENEDEVLGTPQYISPEALTGAPMDTRSDIYSLGATFYEFVTGRVAFDGENAQEIAKKHLMEPLIPPRSVNPDVPEAVSRIIMKMMAKNPFMRYQDAAELIDDLHNARRGELPKASIQHEIMGNDMNLSDGRPQPLNTETIKKMIMKAPDDDSGNDRQRNIYNLKKRQQANAQRAHAVSMVGLVILLVVLIVGGVLGGILYKKHKTESEIKAKKEAELRELARPTPLTDDVDAIEAYARENPADKQGILTMCEEFILKEYVPRKPKEEQALATFQALYVAADEAVMISGRDQESRLLRKQIAQRRDAAEAAEDARLRAERLAREKEEAEEWSRRENQNREERLAREAETMQTTLEEQKAYYAGRMVFQTTNGHLDRAEDDYNAWFQSIDRQTKREDQILADTARPYRDWARAVLDCIASARMIHENTYNGNTIFAGTQIGYGPTGICKIVSINDGVVKAVPGAGSTKPFTFKFDDLDARQRLVLLRKGAGEADRSDQLFFYLLLFGDFVNAKELAKENEELSELIEFVITCYFRYVADDTDTSKDQKLFDALKAKYGTMKEFREVFPKGTRASASRP